MQLIDYRITPSETQIIKSLAIAAMIIHHLFWECPEYGITTHSIAIAGKNCVALFVFLSGYGMATTFPKNIVGQLNTAKTFFFFLCKRYVKFFLNYWVIFFVAVPIGVFYFGRTLENAYGENANVFFCFFMDLLGLQGYHSYNITWWFNKLILVLWLSFPLFYYAMKTRIVSIIILLIIFFNPGNTLHFLETIAISLPIYVLPFCIGIFMALHSKGINKILNILPPRLILYGSLGATVSLFFLRGVPLFPNFSYFRVDPFLTVAVVLTVVSICRVSGKRFAFLQYIGKHSMNMYLTHTFILGYFFYKYIYGLESPVVMFTVVFSASLLVSIIFEFVKGKAGFYRMQGRIVSILSKQISSVNN